MADVRLCAFLLAAALVSALCPTAPRADEPEQAPPTATAYPPPTPYPAPIEPPNPNATTNPTASTTEPPTATPYPPAAQEPPAPSPSPAPPKPSQPPAPPLPPEEETWLDTSHAFLSRELLVPVVRLDRFFSDESELEAERYRSILSVRGEVRFRDRGSPVFGSVLRANLRFPGLNRLLENVRLVVVGQSQEQLDTVPSDPAGGPLRTDQLGRAGAEIRYGVWRGRYAAVDLGTGLLLELPPGVFARVRYRAAVPLKKLLLARFATSGFWRTDTRLGTTAELAFERPFPDVALLRLDGTSTLTEKSRGIEWVTQLAALRGLGPRSAISVAGAIEGAQRSPVGVDRYRVYTRYRQDFYRRWLFFELEPQIAWPWNPSLGRYKEHSFTFRLEVQFQGNEPLPLPPHEPHESEEPSTEPATPGGARP